MEAPVSGRSDIKTQATLCHGLCLPVAPGCLPQQASFPSAVDSGPWEVLTLFSLHGKLHVSGLDTHLCYLTCGIFFPPYGIYFLHLEG